MFGRSAASRVVLLVACACVAGCAKSAAPPPPPRIALLSGVEGFQPGSFDAAAAAGLAACAALTGAKITQATPDSAADVEAQLTLLATQDFDTIISLGNGTSVDAGRVARRFETTHFVVIDGFAPAPNVTSISFKEQEGSFLAGALAALVSKTKKIAFLGGEDIPRLAAAEAGFEAGAREVDPRVRVVRAFAGSFVDAAAGRATAKALYGAGSDVIYVVAGPAGLGAIAQAKDAKNGYAIGVDSDQDALAPGKVLTSVVTRIDRAAGRVCSEAAAQKQASGRVELGLADGAIALSGFRYSKAIVGAATIARVARIEAAIVAGTIVPPASPAQLAAFRPVRVL